MSDPGRIMHLLLLDIRAVHVVAQFSIKIVQIRYILHERTTKRSARSEQVDTWNMAYKSVYRLELVDMDEPLKAGHCVDPDREMQVPAISLLAAQGNHEE